MPSTELPTLLVKDATAWSKWLLQHASTSPGVWLIMAKKGTTTPTSLTSAQALDEALCFGWINGQAKSRDAGTVFQRYTPRTARSTWSQVNQGHVARLEAGGRMQERGKLEVERAKGDGRWEAAYGGFAALSDAKAAPVELMKAIEGREGAMEAWEGLSKTEKYVVVLRLTNLKTEKGREGYVRRTVEGLTVGKGKGKDEQEKVSEAKKGRKRKREADDAADP